MHVQMDGWMEDQIVCWMNGQMMDAQIDGWMDKLVDGCMDNRRDEWMDEWMHAPPTNCLIYIAHLALVTVGVFFFLIFL